MVLLYVLQLAHALDPRGPDFDGDGYDDLAIGGHDEVSGHGMAGAVHLLYGSPTGLHVPEGYLTTLHQDVPGVEGGAASDDYFGFALTWGDFDGDCYDDLLVGAPRTDDGEMENVGVVQVFYGSENGLDASRDAIFYRDTPNIADEPVANERFGMSLAAGDFDGDGYEDVAIGVPEDMNGGLPIGGVQILYGSEDGLQGTSPADVVFSLNSSGVDEVASSGDSCGGELAAGDFDCDGRSDLAFACSFASPTVNGAAVNRAGRVHVLYGSAGGLSSTATRPDQVYTQGVGGMGGVAEPDDLLGAFYGSLTAGNFDDNASGGRDCEDLVIGVSQEDQNSIVDSGAVHVLYGSSSSGLQLSSPADAVFTQDDPAAVPGISEAGDQFGSHVTVGQVDDDAYDELIVGYPENASEPRGAVTLLRGGSSGVTTNAAVVWTPTTPVISDVATTFSGANVGTGDFDGDNRTDLAVGAVGSDAAVSSGGEVIEILSATGFWPNVDTATSWTVLDFPGETAEEFDMFGIELTTARRTPGSCVR